MNADPLTLLYGAGGLAAALLLLCLVLALRISRLREQLAREETLRQQQALHHDEKLRLLNDARETLRLQFKQLAGDILEQKGRIFAASSKEQLQALLKPLGEKIHHFEQRVQNSYGEEARQRFALEKEIHSLLELNARISADAVNLTQALRGENKTQGLWGEVILARVLEKSGLERGREYEVQVSLHDGEGGKGQPDVVLQLPEGKQLVIDSKVSLGAYLDYCASEDADAKARYLRLHLQSIRNHVRELSEKNYQHLRGLNTLDYVLMFLPVESAFTLALQSDDQLCNDAFARNIILVGPSTLLASLRTIQSLWRNEYQNRNAQEIADQAGRLYDKFADFISDLEEIGYRLEQSHKAWDQARAKLSGGKGNLLSRMEKLRKLGARNRKALPPVADEEHNGDEDDDEKDRSDDA
ncbi:MAG: DNA recombination protein RmuC [Pseudomonadales bacterium]|jgi:DNA recombination protein RmuC|nr:DNA recombination protein RmuC [Pseudomonadales bacterium]